MPVWNVDLIPRCSSKPIWCFREYWNCSNITKRWRCLVA